MLREDITGRHAHAQGGSVARAAQAQGGRVARAGGPPAARHRQRVDGLVVAAHDGGWPTEGSGIKTAPSVTVTRPPQSHVRHSGMVHSGYARVQVAAEGQRDDAAAGPRHTHLHYLEPKTCFMCAAPTCISSTCASVSGGRTSVTRRRGCSSRRGAVPAACPRRCMCLPARHTSHVTRQTSHVTRHTSHATRRLRAAAAAAPMRSPLGMAHTFTVLSALTVASLVLQEL